MNHPSEQDLVLYAMGDADGMAETEAHLAGCADCRDELDAVRHLLAATEQLPVPEPDAGFEERIWRRQRRELRTAQERETLENAATVEISAVQRSIVRPPLWSMQRMVLVGSVAAMLVIAFLVGLYSAPPGTEIVPEPGPGAATASGGDAGAPAPGRDRVLLIAVGDHLERARMVLVELVNAETPNGAGAVDLSTQQARAEQLLVDNRLYRQSASLQGQSDVADVLEEIERVLVEVARSPGQMESAEIEWLRERIQARDLLFKVSVIEGRTHRDDDSFLRPMEAL